MTISYRNAVTYYSPAAALVVNVFLAGMEVLPRSVVLEHCVEDHQELSHAGRGDDHWLFALDGQILAEGADHRIATSCRKRSHVENVADGSSSAAELTATPC